MYNIEKKPYGFKLTFSNFIQADDMAQWVEDSKKTLSAAPSKFNIFVDMRTLKPLPKEAQEYMQTGQKLYKKKGMERSVVILNNSLVTMQFKRIAKETGIYDWERYIDSSSVNNWEQAGVDWIQKGIDPDNR